MNDASPRLADVVSQDQRPPRSPKSAGRKLTVPRSRRLAIDLLRFSKQVPTQVLMRQCSLPKLPGLVNVTSPGVTWSTVFLKAFALVAGRNPELQRMWVSSPRPHLYEHPYCIARLAVPRKHNGEDWLFFARLVRPETRSLPELQARIERLKTAPIEDLPEFRRQFSFSGYPGFLRRITVWASLNLSGNRRSRRFGTFAVTTEAAMGAVGIHPPCVGPMTLSHGPVSDTGEVPLMLVFDQRVHDGGEAGRYLAELEATLNGKIAEELMRMLGSAGDFRRAALAIASTPATKRRAA